MKTHTFNELPGLLADLDFMIQKNQPTPPLSQAFMAATSTHLNTPTAGSESHTTANQAHLLVVQQLASQLGYHLTPSAPSQAFYSSRSTQNNRGRGYNNNRGRGRNSNNRQTGGNRSHFEWASNTNTVYGSCNRCGIGHIPSLCPNRDPSTVRTRPSANFANHRSTTSTTWLPDTGANSHVTPDLASLGTSEAYHGDDALHVGNGMGLPNVHIGSTHISSPHKTLSLSNILHVPQIQRNLLSVQKFCLDNHVFFEFHPFFFCVKDISTRTTLLTGPSKDGLYSLVLPQLQSIRKSAFSATRASSAVWHQRLGHPHHKLLRIMLSK